MSQGTGNVLLKTDSSDLSARSRVWKEVPSSDLTTFGVGSPVPLLLEPKGLDSLRRILGDFILGGIPWRIIGAGSNVLLPDRPLGDALIRLGREFAGIALLPDLATEEELRTLALAPPIDVDLSLGQAERLGSQVKLYVGGGASLMGVSRKACRLGLSGLEFAAGIPASLGGAVAMNAGAHNSEMSEVVSRVVVLTSGGEMEVLNASDLGFSYRKSNLPEKSIVVGVELIMKPGSGETISAERNRCLDYRKQTQPLQLPSAGSVFRNPGAAGNVGDERFPDCFSRPAAALLLEKVGMKGKSRGNVSFSEMHSNWLVRRGENAASSDAQALIAEAQREVAQAYQVELIPEVIIW